MALGVKCGDTISVTVSGADEEAAFNGIKSVIESNL